MLSAASFQKPQFVFYYEHYNSISLQIPSFFYYIHDMKRKGKSGPELETGETDHTIHDLPLIEICAWFILAVNGWNPF